jgi:hypothetical protein
MCDMMDSLEYAVERYHNLLEEAELRRAHTGRTASRAPAAPVTRAVLLVVGMLLINLGTRIMASCGVAPAQASGEESSSWRAG